MRYLILILLISYSCFANGNENTFLYNEVLGPQKGALAPNIEFKLLENSNDTLNESSLRFRAGISVLNLVWFSWSPSYLAGFHYITGQNKKLDLGVAIVYENYKDFHYFNTATSLSFTLGFRHSIGDDWFIGGAICPTFSEENIPSYPISFKFGFSL